MTTLIYILFGFLSGILGGLGMGGGTILIPLLTIFVDLDQKMSQGINLIAFLIMALFSLIIHYKNGFIKTRGIIYIILSGLFFSLLGAFAANVIPSRILRVCFGIFLIILSFEQIFKIFKKNKTKER